MLGNRHGLHLRPATRFAQEALRFRAEVRVVLDGQEVNGKSILMLTSLAAERGARLKVRAEGDDAEECVRALESLVAARFGEDAAPGA
ncbi:MAG TPA: HPr family phosphocarrier protein [Planctomycetota bacterium]|nr:HPr family phosphocarrier protein [Planctomycetota bacterium]